jgi:phage/plasmid-like protein (TIGR03299 family)
MPSGITKTDGMMYVGAEPWHGLGVKLDNPATAEEAIAAANLDWQVIEEPIYTQDPAGVFRPIPNKKAIIREDTREVFAAMGNGYTITQNRTKFDFFNAVVGQDLAIYHTALSLHGGRRICILAKLPQDIEIIPGDVVQPYILLSDSHDGSMALRMRLTPIRVVCANTLSVALHQAGTSFYAKHTRNILSKAADARELLGMADAYFQLFATQVDELVSTRMTALETQSYFQKVYQFDQGKTFAKQDHRVVTAYDQTIDLLSHPTNRIGGIEGTAWAALNAVTYYVDHERAVRGSQEAQQDRRLNGSWFGSGAKIRQRAYDLIMS